MSNTNKFTYPLAIEGSKEQLDALMPELVKLGYIGNWYANESYPVLCTDENGALSGTFIGSVWMNDKNPTVLPASQKDLILAIAAACTNDVWMEGEWLIGYNEWQKVDKLLGCTVEGDDYRRPTKEEFIAKFTKPDVAEKTNRHVTNMPLAESAPNDLLSFSLDLAKGGEYDVVWKKENFTLTDIHFMSNGDVVAIGNEPYAGSTSVYRPPYQNLFLKPKVKSMYIVQFEFGNVIAFGDLDEAMTYTEAKYIFEVSTDGTSTTVHTFKK